MSIVGWHGCADVQIVPLPSLKCDRLAEFFPPELIPPLRSVLSEGKKTCTVKDLHQLIGGNALKHLFQLDRMFCQNYLQVQFGPPRDDIPPLIRIEAVGYPGHIPLRRVEWRSRKHGEWGMLSSRFTYTHRLDHQLAWERPLSGLRCMVNSEIFHRLLFPCFYRGTPGADLLRECPPEYRPALRELLGVLCQTGFLELLPPGKHTLERLEEEASSAQWDFHNLLFHSETHDFSAWGQREKFNQFLYFHGHIPPSPALYSRYSGKKIALKHPPTDLAAKDISLEEALRQRRSVRIYDREHPLTLAEIGIFLSRLCRGKDLVRPPSELPIETLESRSYPSGGSLYEQEIYLSIFRCDGLKRGFYHYDSTVHALVHIPFPPATGSRLLDYEHIYGEWATNTENPDLVLHISARFHRLSWKYRQIAYSLTLKNLGCMYQSMYLIACSMNLASCAMGIQNASIFAELTGCNPYSEGPIGEFNLGRPPSQTNPLPRKPSSVPPDQLN